MDQLFTFILEQTAKGKIEKDTAIHLVKTLKQSDFKETDDIAIIGMSGQFPLANNPEQYWQNLRSGLDLSAALPEQRRQDLIDYLRFSKEDEKWGEAFADNGGLEEIDKFDYKFFRMSYKEAVVMDPNQRLFLQTAWQAFEDAGYGGKKLAGSQTGVYVGFASNFRDMYLKLVAEADPLGLPLAVVGNQAAVLPSRISYLMDLRGPTMVLDTACSSSLVAISLACEALQSGKCEMALAGGVKLNMMPFDSDLTRVGFESSDGKTRSFNEGSDGAGYGEGVAAIVLKPLKKALKDGDSIYAVIKGTAINQDGNSVGLSAPNPAAQTDLIVKAWEDAKVQPETIQYIETHGTGTSLGDPIEIKGIQDAFRKYTNKKQFCAVGSVKTNHGHPFEAAGIMSLIKMVKALQNKEMPPTLYFQNPNRAIHFTDSPVFVNTKLRAWPEQEGPRRCGISGFGISGTNAHVVLEEAPVTAERRPAPASAYLLALSAKSDYSLKQLVSDYLGAIELHPEWDLGNVCYTANTGRGHHNHRLAIIFRDREDLLAKLSRLQAELSTDEANGVSYRVVKIVNGTKAKQAETDMTEREREELTVQAATRISALTEAGTVGEQAIREIAAFYANGAEVEWDKLYDAKSHTRLHLPVYPFERTRCWVEFPEYVPAEPTVAEPEDQFFQMQWYPNQHEEQQVEITERTVLIFRDERGLWRELSDRISGQSQRMIYVEFGDAFRKVDDQNYVIAGLEDDYHQLVADINEGELSRILHLASIREAQHVSSFKQLQDTQTRGVYSMFYLLRALVAKGLDQGVNFTVISENINSVTGNEPIFQPENAPLFGIAKTITQEHPGLNCRNIEIDAATSIDDIFADLVHLHAGETLQAAYRDGVRYTERFSEVPVDALADQPIEVLENGVYLVTGGLGGLGREVSKHLAGKNRITLAMVNRMAFPDRSTWDDVLASDADDKLKKRINGIRELEALGATVVCYQADISDPASMQAVVTDLKSRFGAVNGVVHCAGIPGDGFLFKRSQEAFDRVLHPKVYGTWLLHDLLQGEPIDFFLNFSSGLSILSEPGHGDYTAANSYLDTFASYLNVQGQKALTINWTTWKETGMAVDYGFDHDAFFKTISTEQALQGLETMLNKNIGRVLIGEFSFNPQFLVLIDRLPFKLSEKIITRTDQIKKEQGLGNKGPRAMKKGGAVVLSGRDGEEFSDIEKRIAAIYNEVLGYSEINIHDSFFELGGDSIAINRMHVILDKEFPGQLKLIDLFNHTSVAALSEFLSEQQNEAEAVVSEEEELEALEDMLDNLESGNLSIDDMIKNFT